MSFYNVMLDIFIILVPSIDILLSIVLEPKIVIIFRSPKKFQTVIDSKLYSNLTLSSHLICSWNLIKNMFQAEFETENLNFS